MPRKGFTNLSVDATQQAKIRRDFEKKDIGVSFPVWAIGVLRSAIDRLDYLEKNFPHIKLVSVLPDSLVLEDTSKKIMIKIYREDNKLVSSVPDSSDYILYAGIHPEMKF